MKTLRNNKIFVGVASFFLAILFLFGSYAYADDATQITLNPFSVVSGYIKSRSATNGLQVTSLANQNCLGTDSTGKFGAGTCSGGGGGSSATTTINGLSTVNYTFVATTTQAASYGIATTAPGTVLFNIPISSGSITGLLNSTDWTTFNNKQPAGSYLTASSTIIAGGTATFSPSVTFATSSPSTDWSIICSSSTCTFDHPNNLQTTITNPVTGTGTVGYSAYWTSGTAISGGASLINNGTVAGVNATSATVSLNVQGTTTLNPFNVASSSTQSILQVLSSNGVLLSQNASSTNSSTSLASTVPALQFGTTALSSPSANGTYIGGNSPATFTGNFVHFQSNGTTEFSVNSSGQMVVANQYGVGNTNYASGSVCNCTTATMLINTNLASTAGYELTVGQNASTARAVTTNGSNSGGITLNSTEKFSPASGSAAFNGISINNSIAQTSVATGVTTGININPTLTSAYDYRSLFVPASQVTISSGTPVSELYNGLFQPFTYSNSSTSLYTIATSSTLNIAGAPIASTTRNIILTDSIGLNIEPNALNASTTKGIGLNVYAPTGATNNYAALFTGGNIGIGLTAPVATLDILGVKSTTATLVLNAVGGTGIAGSTRGQDITLTTGNGKEYITSSQTVGTGGAFNFTGGAGGDLNDTTITGTVTAGAGSSITTTAGSGGNTADTPNSAAVTLKGGTGGGLLYVSGAGGDGSLSDLTNTTGGNSGPVQFTTGFGGNSISKSISIGGNSGLMTFSSNRGGNTTANAGSTASTGGNSGGYTVSVGAGGAVSKVGAQNAAAVFTGGNSGAISITGGAGGAAVGTGAGTAPATTLGGTAGNISISGASGGNATGGTSSNTGGGGSSISIISGKGGTGATANGADGNINFIDGYNNTILSILGNNTQKIGINSTTPNATLVVQGTSTQPTIDVLNVASSSFASLFVVKSSGNVGIGTTTPSQLFYVFGNLQAATGTTSTLLANTATQTVTVQNLIVNGTLSVTGTSTLATTTITNLTVSGSTSLQNASTTSISASANIWDKNNNKVLGGFTKTFWLASTTQTTITGKSFGSSTTTLEIMGFPYAVTLNRLACQTDAGSVNVVAGSGAASSTSISVGTGGASTTPAVALIADQTVYVQASSTTTTGDGLRCTLNFVPQ